MRISDDGIAGNAAGASGTVTYFGCMLPADLPTTQGIIICSYLCHLNFYKLKKLLFIHACFFIHAGTCNAAFIAQGVAAGMTISNCRSCATANCNSGTI